MTSTNAKPATGANGVGFDTLRNALIYKRKVPQPEKKSQQSKSLRCPPYGLPHLSSWGWLILRSPLQVLEPCAACVCRGFNAAVLPST
jgi:hypothetical protein